MGKVIFLNEASRLFHEANKIVIEADSPSPKKRKVLKGKPVQKQKRKKTLGQRIYEAQLAKNGSDDEGGGLMF